MTAASIESEVLDLERKYWQAIKDGDAKTTALLSDDPCVVAGAQGVGKIDRATLEKMFSSASWKLTAFDLSSPIVRMITQDVAVVAYKVREDLTVEGKPIALEAADTSIWVRRGDSWVCAVHTEAVAGDPFGRDRAR
jgi:hypothetical protein